jgi:hypothetical protein
MNGDRDLVQSEWQRWVAAQSRQKPPETAGRPAPGTSVFVGVLVADVVIVGIALMAAMAIGFQSWGQSQDVVHSLAAKQEGQFLTAGGFACAVLAGVGLLAWKQRAMAAVALQCVVIAVVLVVTGSLALSFHHMAETHPMFWLRFRPQ